MSSLEAAPSIRPAVQRAAALRLAGTLLLGAAAGGLAVLLNSPLPWTIGPLLATAVCSTLGAPMVASNRLRNVGQWVIGSSLGLYFTPQVVGLVLGHWAVIALGVVWALVMGLAFGAFLRWSNPGNPLLDRPTLFFSSTVGSASEMAMLAERFGGRLDLVASAHSLRVLLVVVVIPFGLKFSGIHGVDTALPGVQEVHLQGLLILCPLTIAAGALMQRLGVINPWVLGPLAVGIALTSNGIELSSMPRWMVSAAQVVISVALGTRFTPAFVHSAPRWLSSVTLGTLLMIVVSGVYAIAIASLSGLHPVTVLLGTSPGGVTEMAITAKVMQLGVPMVTALHVTRLVGVLVLSGPLFRLLGRRG